MKILKSALEINREKKGVSFRNKEARLIE